MRVVRIPAEECMFAELPKPAGRGRSADQELRYAFEAVLPTEIDEVHMVFASAGERVIGGAIPRTVLYGYQQSAEMLIPDRLPEWITCEDPNDLCEQLNFLTGAFQPDTHLRRSEGTLKLTCFLLLLSSGLFYLGASRKADQREAEATRLRADISSMYNRVLPPAAGSTQPDSIRFQTIMNQLSATRSGTTDSEYSHEIIPALASVLQAWPADQHAQVRSLQIGRTDLRLEAGFPDNSMASAMIEHFQKAVGWAMQSHQVSARADQVDLSVQLTRTQHESGAEHD